MFSVTVRDHVMIAHSFRGEVFGPAQRLHGATYVVDATFRRAGPGGGGRGVGHGAGGRLFRRAHWAPAALVVDMGAASRELTGVLGELNYRNLDDEPAFAGRNT